MLNVLNESWDSDTKLSSRSDVSSLVSSSKIESSFTLLTFLFFQINFLESATSIIFLILLYIDLVSFSMYFCLLFAFFSAAIARISKILLPGNSEISSASS